MFKDNYLAISFALRQHLEGGHVSPLSRVSGAVCYAQDKLVDMSSSCLSMAYPIVSLYV